MSRLVALVFAGLAAACASRGALDARYERSLARWQDAPRAELLAHWGTPQAVEKLPDGREALVYVAHHEFEGLDRRPMVTVATGTHGGIVDSGMPITPVVPVTCTTRFVLQGDVVRSWSFEGVACGAP
jgi:hypothetical protein